MTFQMRQNSKLKHFRYFCYINGFLHYSKYDKLFNLKVKVNKVIFKTMSGTLRVVANDLTIKISNSQIRHKTNILFKL